MREKPKPMPVPQSMTAWQIAPDCDTKAISPGFGTLLMKVVLNGTCVSIRPMQFGPIRRRP